MTKKKQSTTLSLQSFLAETDTADSSWVDENHELPTAPVSRDRHQTQAPRDARKAPPVAASKTTKPVPTEPPFTIFVGQLSFLVDHEELGVLFYNHGCSIKQPRIVKDPENKSKGFGYVEFIDRESMIKALELNGCILRNRPIRVDVADEKRDNQSRTFIDRSSMGSSRQQSVVRQQPAPEDSKLAAANWRSEKSSPRETEPTEGHPTSSGRTPSITREKSPHQRDAMQKRNENNTTGSRSVYRPRDHSNPRPQSGEGDYRDSNNSTSSPRRYNQDSNQFRRGRRSSQSRGPQQRSAHPYHNEDHRPLNDRPTPASSSQRPKLELAPRTLPLTTDSSATSLTATPSSSSSSASTSKRNPFGAARPVDTTQAMKKVEEKLEALKIVSQTGTTPTSTRPSPSSTKTTSPHSSRPRSRSKSGRSRSRSRTNKKHDSLVSPDPGDCTASSSSVENNDEVNSKA